MHQRPAKRAGSINRASCHKSARNGVVSASAAKMAKRRGAGAATAAFSRVRANARRQSARAPVAVGGWQSPSRNNASFSFHAVNTRQVGYNLIRSPLHVFGRRAAVRPYSCAAIALTAASKARRQA
ncbi:MAG TPA: hypothetical protein DEP05_05395 [Betaproteobacteria bacterium]|nr:hypothetical protein [Betaproteobacteria bacterium]